MMIILLLRFNTASTGSASASFTSPFINSTANLHLLDPSTCSGRVLHLINDSDRIGTASSEIVYVNYPTHSNITDPANSYNNYTNTLNYTIFTG